MYKLVLNKWYNKPLGSKILIHNEYIYAFFLETIRRYHLSTLQLDLVLVHEQPVSNFTIHRNLLFSVSVYGKIFSWNLDNLKFEPNLIGSVNFGVNNLIVLEDDRLLVSGGMTFFQEISLITNHKTILLNHIYPSMTRLQNDIIALGTVNGSIDFWDCKNNSYLGTIVAHVSVVQNLISNKWNNKFISISLDNEEIKEWEINFDDNRIEIIRSKILNFNYRSIMFVNYVFEDTILIGTGDGYVIKYQNDRSESILKLLTSISSIVHLSDVILISSAQIILKYDILLNKFNSEVIEEETIFNFSSCLDYSTMKLYTVRMHQTGVLEFTILDLKTNMYKKLAYEKSKKIQLVLDLKININGEYLLFSYISDHEKKRDVLQISNDKLIYVKSQIGDEFFKITSFNKNEFTISKRGDVNIVYANTIERLNELRNKLHPDLNLKYIQCGQNSFKVL
jgi:hypothetical protein